MPELPPNTRDAVVGTFLRAFNSHHSSAFVIKLDEPKEDGSCDYLCQDHGETLKIQLTRAQVSVEADRLPPGEPIHAWIRRPEKHPAIILDTPADSASRAVRAKSEHYGPSTSDLVLVIFFDFRSYENWELDDMRRAVSWELRKAERKYGSCFLEVWAVWDFKGDRGQAHVLWPIPGGENEPGALVPAGVRADQRPLLWENTIHGADDDGLVHIVSLASVGLCGAYILTTNTTNDSDSNRCQECARLLHHVGASIR